MREGEELGRVEAAPLAPPKILKVRTQSVAELAVDFMPFTIGLLHTRLNIQVDPVADFFHTSRGANPELDVAVRDFDRYLFRGIAAGDRDEFWDRRLCFVEHRFWPDLLAHLQAVVLIDHRNGLYFEVRGDLVPVPGAPGAPPAFVTAFGLSGNLANIRTRSALPGPAVVVNLPIEPEVAARAVAVLGAGPGD